VWYKDDYLNTVCSGRGGRHSCMWPKRGRRGPSAINPYRGESTEEISQLWKDLTWYNHKPGAYPYWHDNTPIKGVSGEAKNWAKLARASGWTVSALPQPGSLVVMQPGEGTSNPHGRVDFVDAVATPYGAPLTIFLTHGKTIRPRPSMRFIVMP